MFSKINSIFRKKEIAQIDSLLVDQIILNDADLKTDHIQKNNDGK